MDTPWIEASRVTKACQRNEAFWNNELDDGPLMWVTVPNAKPGTAPAEPDEEEQMWMDVY